MINISTLIYDSLKSITIPIVRLKYSGTKTDYIVWQEYLVMGEDFDDDQETITGHYLQFNIYSKGDFTKISDQVVTLLTNNGFIREDESDNYDTLSNTFFRVIRFAYFEEGDK